MDPGFYKMLAIWGGVLGWGGGFSYCNFALLIKFESLYSNATHKHLSWVLALA